MWMCYSHLQIFHIILHQTSNIRIPADISISEYLYSLILISASAPKIQYWSHSTEKHRKKTKGRDERIYTREALQDSAAPKLEICSRARDTSHHQYITTQLYNTSILNRAH